MSYEKFRKAVYETYKGCLKAHPLKEIDEYFNSDEAEEIIKDAFKADTQKVKEGIISEEILYGDCAGGTGYCLALMF